MPGTNRLMSEEATVNIGALQQRVYGLEQAVNTISQQLTSISQQITSGAKPNWSVLVSTAGFCLLFAGAIGGLAYAPIRENQNDLKLASVETNKAVAALANQTSFQVNQIGKELGRDYVSVRELDGRSSRTRSEIDRLNQDITSVEKVTVPRGEHEEKWRANDQRFSDQQRQIDDLKKFNTDLVSARDFLKNLDDRMRTLELQRRAGP